MLPLKNKNVFTKSNLQKICLFLLLVGVFVVTPVYFAEAQDAAANAGSLAAATRGEPDSDNIFIQGIRWLLYGLLLLLIEFVSVAATLFVWATEPSYVSGPTGFLNLEEVYTLWKFIRDFFNLFFIFLLLFSAFGTVFQLEKFNIKKNFLKIIIAAIAINFSFPLTRLIIDFGNVPMYFFRDMLASANGNAVTGVANGFWSGSGLGGILSADLDPQSNATAEFVSRIMFTFIFAITLFVLAAFFLIRLLKLIILLIFSPFGLAASIIPGIESYGKKWWKELLQTVFFGPAAMLVVVVALRFTAELSGTTALQGATDSATASASGSQNLLAQALFFIPVFMMWMAIGMGKEFGVQGASTVTKYSDKALGFGKKVALGATVGAGSWALWNNSAMKGVRKGVNERAYEGRLFGDKVKDLTKGRLGAEAWKKAGEAREAKIKGFVTGGKKGMEKANNKLRDEKAREQEKKWKEEGLGASELTEKFNSAKTDHERLAAMNMIAAQKEGFEKSEDLSKALEEATRMGKRDLFEKLLQNATGQALEMDSAQMEKLRESWKGISGFKPPERVAGMSDADYAKRVAESELEFQKKFVDKMKTKFKKEGKLKVLIEQDIEATDKFTRASGRAVPPAEIRSKKYSEHLSGLKAKEVAQIKGMTDASGNIDPQLKKFLQEKKASGEWQMKDFQDAYAELDSKTKKAWRDAGFDPRSIT